MGCSRRPHHPRSEHWGERFEWPVGDTGFVWGDDSSCKVQALDSSPVSDGVITRDERFGYVELAMSTWDPPCLHDKPPARNSPPPSFIRAWRASDGVLVVRLAVAVEYSLASGASRADDRG